MNLAGPGTLEWVCPKCGSSDAVHGQMPFALWHRCPGQWRAERYPGPAPEWLDLDRALRELGHVLAKELRLYELAGRWNRLVMRFDGWRARWRA